MNPIQTDPNPKNDSITEPPEMTPVTRFSHSSQEKKRSDNRRKAARYMQDLHRRTLSAICCTWSASGSSMFLSA